MKNVVFTLMLTIIFTAIVTSVQQTKAGTAGVGVLNVPPAYRYVKIDINDSFTIVRLSVSDYNSWKDIWKIEVAAESLKEDIAKFVCYHYKTKDSFEEVNLFEELDENEYLIEDACYVERSLYDKTVDDRCLINVTFTFRSIPSCVRLKIISYDREGETTSANISYYSAYGGPRSKEMMIPFWSGEPVRISPDFPNIFSFSISMSVVALMILRRWKNE